MRELPPRTRRIHQSELLHLRHAGTTSAHAENTLGWVKRSASTRNYLRARGEYGQNIVLLPRHKELPPRTRRIQPKCRIWPVAHGTTSAHAENTRMVAIRCPAVRNYLRARGEYERTNRSVPRSMELPPRTRRIRFSWGFRRSRYGTTSAHAENTFRGWIRYI